MVALVLGSHANICWPSAVESIARRTDWAAIVARYDVLAALDAIDAASVTHHRGWHSARGHLLAEMGRRGEAAAALSRAMALRPAPAEATYLQQRIARLDGTD